MRHDSKVFVGARFGRLTILELIPGNKQGKPPAKLRVLCDCGVEKIVRRTDVRFGKSKSCGCVHSEVLAIVNKSLNPETRRKMRMEHGKTFSPTWWSWIAMRNRCLNPKNKMYHYYGGLGVTVCDRWNKFENFLADMGERPVDKTLDRFPNPAGNYEPDNCRWATRQEQSVNQRRFLNKPTTPANRG